MLRIVSVVVVVFLSLNALQGQVNVFAGYRTSFTKPETFNAIIEAHNDAFDLVDYSISEIKYLHGVDLGLRYSFRSGAVQTGWINRRKQVRSDVPQFTNRVSTSINTFNVGYYPTFGNFSFGATADYNLLRIKNELERRGGIPDPSKDLQNPMKSDAWSSHFSIGYEFSNGGYFSLKIEPYIQVYWDDYNIAELSAGIAPDYSGSTREEFMTFGISFIVYNGPRR